MSSFQNDQAAGLRRIMAAPKPRIVSIISASATQNLPRLMSNLAASIMSQGNDVLVVHASHESRETDYEVDKLPSLLEVTCTKTSVQHATKKVKLGFSVAKLMPKDLLAKPMDTDTSTPLNHAFNLLAQSYEIILVDATLNTQQVLPLKTLNESEIIIQLNRKPESITQAYTLIKHICSELGRRSFGIIVDEATDAQAQIVFRNISQVTKRFMQIELEYFGAVPTDDHLSRATKLGRSVIDAFPLAIASTALKQIAQRLDFKHDYASNMKTASQSLN
ncbi:MAG: MotR [Methylotenera sp.]|nr:MotR [Methylotenera sp.]MDP2402978.1 MotR [Methylotenera sp.]MDP3094484.1 MotR [Methylotenera sp.]MDZ4223518.1 MotR [Methylotenera sp.]